MLGVCTRSPAAISVAPAVRLLLSQPGGYLLSAPSNRLRAR